MNSFADVIVRIRESPETRAAGLAGLRGVVMGFTTPSIVPVDVIGGAPDDHAINVDFDDLDQDFWFRPDLLEVVDAPSRS